MGLHPIGQSSGAVFAWIVLSDPTEEPSKARQTAAGSPKGGARRHRQSDRATVFPKRGSSMVDDLSDKQRVLQGIDLPWKR
jgi:hypothetical protein